MTGSTLGTRRSRLGTLRDRIPFVGLALLPHQIVLDAFALLLMINCLAVLSEFNFNSMKFKF